MIKRIISAVLCAFVAAATVPAYMDSVGHSYSAEAAVDYDTPYYYDQLTDRAKIVYEELKKAVPECKKTVRVRTAIDQNDFDMLSEFVMCHDMAMFNVEEMEAVLVSRNTVEFTIKYRYSKENYEKMIAALDKKTDAILKKLNDDMSTYTKIRTIHDAIVKAAEYDLDSKTNDTVYGALVKNKAKCDGYAKAFNYVCSKAGIRVVNVRGNALNETGKYEPHMWNKVYYNKKWYNVDLTWDDLDDVNYKNYYGYFMISDDEIAATHKEGTPTRGNYNFENPAANDDSIGYYEVNKKYAEDIDGANDIIRRGLKTAVKNNVRYFEFQCSPSTFNKVVDYLDEPKNLCMVLASVKRNTGKDIITDFYTYSLFEESNVVCIPIFYEGSDLEDYFSDPDLIDQQWLDILAEYDID